MSKTFTVKPPKKYKNPEKVETKTVQTEAEVQFNIAKYLPLLANFGLRSLEIDRINYWNKNEILYRLTLTQSGEYPVTLEEVRVLHPDKSYNEIVKESKS